LGNTLSHVAVHVNHGAVPVNIADMTRFEQRLCVFSFVQTVWFYIPVLVHHLVVELRAAGAEQPHALAMSTLVIFSLGILLAEYPSGVFADWVGRKHALALSCLLHAAGMVIYASWIRQGARRRCKARPRRPRFRAPICSSPVARGRGGPTRTCGRGRGTLARCIRFSGVPSHTEGQAETLRQKLVHHGSDVPCASPGRTCTPDMMDVCSHRA
jgi:hypothetical protein